MQPLEVFYKKVFLEISHNSQENICSRVYDTRMFSCEFCEISKNTFFTEHLQTTAFEKHQTDDILGFCFCSGRRIHPEVFCKKNVRRNFDKFAEKHLCWSLSFNKVSGLQPATFLENRLSTKNIRETFSCEFGKIFKKRTIFIEHLRLLLCKIKFLIGDLSEGGRGDLILHGVLS